MKLKNAIIDAMPTDDFYYDLFIGGYFNPDKLLDEESAEKVKQAIKTINQYEQLLIDNDLIEEM